MDKCTNVNCTSGFHYCGCKAGGSRHRCGNIGGEFIATSRFTLSKLGTRRLMMCEGNKAHNDACNPTLDAAVSAANRETKVAAAAAAAAVAGVDGPASWAQLLALVHDFFRRHAHLFAAGSRAYVYFFQWTAPRRKLGLVKDARGRVLFPPPAAALDAEERAESVNALTGMPSPPLFSSDASGALCNVKASQVHFEGSPACIHRVLVSPHLVDATGAEKAVHELDTGAKGFAGHQKNGGSSARQEAGHVYGLSALVLPDGFAGRLRGAAVRFQDRGALPSRLRGGHGVVLRAHRVHRRAARRLRRQCGAGGRAARRLPPPGRVGAVGCGGRVGGGGGARAALPWQRAAAAGGQQAPAGGGGDGARWRQRHRRRAVR